MVRLQREKTKLEEEMTGYRKHLAEFEQQQAQVPMAGPTIEVVDPLVVWGGAISRSRKSPWESWDSSVTLCAK